ncbi:MAG: hypothetical protein IT158_04805 [Bryobacterales bacterium]|nr:hypothetical protein [Bryobacterales bacterium]
MSCIPSKSLLVFLAASLTAAAQTPSANADPGSLEPAPALAAESPIRPRVESSRNWLLNPALSQPAPLVAVPRPYVTTEEKLHYYLRDTFGRNAQLGAMANGVFSQLMDSAGNWGTGFDGYSGRIASRVGNRTVRNSMRFGLDVAMGIDSRYRRSQSDKFLPRLGHALASTVVAYRNDGARTFAAPTVISGYGTAFLTNAWYPAGENSTRDALMRGTTNLGWTAGKNVLREFWPDIKKLFGK